MGGQLDGLLSHWQPAFANKLMMMICRLSNGVTFDDLE